MSDESFLDGVFRELKELNEKGFTPEQQQRIKEGWIECGKEEAKRAEEDEQREREQAEWWWKNKDRPFTL